VEPMTLQRGQVGDLEKKVELQKMAYTLRVTTDLHVGKG
jgi:hypothetical protein